MSFFPEGHGFRPQISAISGFISVKRTIAIHQEKREKE